MSQQRHSIDMTHGPLAGKILLFALPLMVTNVLHLMFNVVDTIVVGRFAGTAALAAVGACSPLTSMFVGLFTGCSAGVDVVISQAIGAGNTDEARRGVHTSVPLALVLGLILAAAGIFFAEPLLLMTNAPAEVLDPAVIYLRIYFLGAPANMVYSFCAALLRSQGDAKRPLVILTSAGVANVVLNLIFVIFFHMTTDGVALATILSQYVSAALVLRCLLREKGILRLELQKIRVEQSIALRILRIGFPVGVENSLYALGNVVVQSAINGFGSTAIIAGSSTATNVDTIIATFSGSVNQAALTFIGQNYGARQYRRIDRTLLISCGYVLIISLTLGNLANIFSYSIVSIWVPGEEAVIREAMVKIACICPFLFTIALNGIFTSALRGLGYSIIPSIVSIFTTCGFRALWVALVLPQFGTPASLYLVYPVGWALNAAISIFFFLLIRRKMYSKETLQYNNLKESLS